MTISKPLRFILQLLVLVFLVTGAYQISSYANWFGGAIWIMMAAGLWWLSRRKTAA